MTSLEVYAREKQGLRVLTPLSGSSGSSEMFFPFPEAACWNGDGTALAYAELNKEIHIVQASGWSGSAGKKGGSSGVSVRRLAGSDSRPVKALSWSPKSTYLVSYVQYVPPTSKEPDGGTEQEKPSSGLPSKGMDDKNVTVWDVSVEPVKPSVTLTLKKFWRWSWPALKWTADERWCLFLEPSYVVVLDGSKHALPPVLRIPFDAVQNVEVAPFATELSPLPPPPHPGRLAFAAFSPNRGMKLNDQTPAVLKVFDLWYDQKTGSFLDGNGPEPLTSDETDYENRAVALGKLVKPVLSVPRLIGISECELLWGPRGHQILAFMSSEEDRTGASYYGQNFVYFWKLEWSGTDVEPIKIGKGSLPIADVKWSPVADEFIMIQGHTNQAEVLLFDGRNCEFRFKLGQGYKNTIKWNPFGSMVVVGGFGNLAGDMDFYFRECENPCMRKISSVNAHQTVSCEWAPDGMHFMTAVLNPRRRIDNCYKIWSCDGKIVGERSFEELLEVAWRPVKYGTYSDPGLPVDMPALEDGADMPKRYVPPALRNKQASGKDRRESPLPGGVRLDERDDWGAASEKADTDRERERRHMEDGPVREGRGRERGQGGEKHSMKSGSRGSRRSGSGRKDADANTEGHAIGALYLESIASDDRKREARPSTSPNANAKALNGSGVLATSAASLMNAAFAVGVKKGDEKGGKEDKKKSGKGDEASPVPKTGGLNSSQASLAKEKGQQLSPTAVPAAVPAKEKEKKAAATKKDAGTVMVPKTAHDDEKPKAKAVVSPSPKAVAAALSGSAPLREATPASASAAAGEQREREKKEKEREEKEGKMSAWGQPIKPQSSVQTIAGFEATPASAAAMPAYAKATAAAPAPAPSKADAKQQPKKKDVFEAKAPEPVQPPQQQQQGLDKKNDASSRLFKTAVTLAQSSPPTQPKNDLPVPLEPSRSKPDLAQSLAQAQHQLQQLDLDSKPRTAAPQAQAGPGGYAAKHAPGSVGPSSYAGPSPHQQQASANTWSMAPGGHAYGTGQLSSRETAFPPLGAQPQPQQQQPQLQQREREAIGKSMYSSVPSQQQPPQKANAATEILKGLLGVGGSKQDGPLQSPSMQHGGLAQVYQQNQQQERQQGYQGFGTATAPPGPPPAQSLQQQHHASQILNGLNRINVGGAPHGAGPQQSQGPPQSQPQPQQRGGVYGAPGAKLPSYDAPSYHQPAVHQQAPQQQQQPPAYGQQIGHGYPMQKPAIQPSSQQQQARPLQASQAPTPSSSSYGDPRMMMMHPQMQQQQGPSVDALKERCWYYLDPKGRKQGPFFAHQMKQWSDSGYFEATLPVSWADGGQSFKPLYQLYPDDTRRFTIYPKAVV